MNTPAVVALFTDRAVENRLQIYFNQTYSTKFNIEVTANINKNRTGKIIGRQKAVDETLVELQTLISSFRTKTFNETTGQKYFLLLS